MGKLVICLFLLVSFCASNSNAAPDKTDMAPYIDHWSRKIKRNWYPPKHGPYKIPKVKFDILPDGSVQNLKLEVSSDFQIANKAAIDAVKNAAPFTHFPLECNVKKVTVCVYFKLFANKEEKFMEIE